MMFAFLEALEWAVAYWADRLTLHYFFVCHACVVVFHRTERCGTVRMIIWREAVQASAFFLRLCRLTVGLV